MVARPITAKDRQAVKRLHAAGKSRNDIARAIKRSPSTVSKLATELGLTFARAPQVEAATAVRKADLAARRAQFAEALQDTAERELGKMQAPTLYWEWGSKDHTYAQKLADEPTAADRRRPPVDHVHHRDRRRPLPEAGTAARRRRRRVPQRDRRPDGRPYYAEMRVDDAWYSGDRKRLAQVYGHHVHRAERRRRLWGRRGATQHGRRDHRLHVPLPGDIASTSADLRAEHRDDARTTRPRGGRVHPTKVKTLHPEWDDKAVSREVAAILRETRADAAPDPVGTFPLTA